MYIYIAIIEFLRRDASPSSWLGGRRRPRDETFLRFHVFGVTAGAQFL